MRAFLVGLVSGLVALVGFAGSANASATVDLLWAATGTNSITGVSTSSNIVLNVVLTAGANGSAGGGVSVDYSLIAGDFSVISALNYPAAPLNQSFGAPVITATQVQNIQAFAFPPGPAGITAGQSFLMGTITFHVDSVPLGTLSISSLIVGTDALSDGNFVDITGASTFNSAQVNPVPEPGTISLLGMGLGGLYVVGRRSGRKR